MTQIKHDIANASQTQSATAKQEFLNSLKLDIDFDSIDLEDIETAEELEEYLQENQYFDVEIIYYANAMDFLRENDPSLRESLELAYEMGYTEFESINSELLASILASDMLREEFAEKYSEIEEFFNELTE